MFTKNKSPETSFYSNDEVLESLMLKLNHVQAEMRHQRADLSTIKRQLHTLINSSALQKQVDTYFDEDTEHIPEVDDGNRSSN